MKTQLIPLESHDDLISIRDRMSWAKTPRILLVWPTSERIHLRPLDLVVLQRHAASLGAQLGLVTRKRGVRREAIALGIPAFLSTGEAQRETWPEWSAARRAERPPRRDLRALLAAARFEEGRWRQAFAVRFGAFILGVLAVLAVVSLFIPQARVELAPERDTQSISLPAQADPAVERVLITGVLPLERMQVAVAGERQMLAGGSTAVPEARAEGTVVFRNLTPDALRIPAGTVLISSGLPGVRFETVATAQLEGGINESVTVAVRAEAPGANGNVEAGTIQAIEGGLGLAAIVSNPEPTAGGSDRLAQAPTAADREELRQALLEDLELEALSAMEARRGPGDQLLADSLEITRVASERYDPAEGQPGRTLALAMEVEFSAAYISGADLKELAENVFRTGIPEGFVASEAPIVFEPLDSYQVDPAGRVRWTLRARREIERQVDPGRVAGLIRGLRPQEAARALEAALPLEGSAVIQLRPGWWPWLPLIPFNYTVVVR